MQFNVGDSVHGHYHRTASIHRVSQSPSHTHCCIRTPPPARRLQLLTLRVSPPPTSPSRNDAQGSCLGQGSVEHGMEQRVAAGYGPHPPARRVQFPDTSRVPTTRQPIQKRCPGELPWSVECRPRNGTTGGETPFDRCCISMSRPRSEPHMPSRPCRMRRRKEYYVKEGGARGVEGWGMHAGMGDGRTDGWRRKEG